MRFRLLQINLAACLLAVFTGHSMPSQAQEPSGPKTPAALDAAIPSTALLQPAELVKMLHASETPLILQVGSHVLYAEAHIPGSEYVGAAGQDSGLQALRDRVRGLKPDRLLVIYCGCCPWNKCPNIRPAYRQLEALGFTRVRVLYLANNFGADWVSKGYPTAQGR